MRNPWEIDWNDPAQARTATQAPLIQRPPVPPMQAPPQAQTQDQAALTAEQLRQAQIRTQILQRQAAQPPALSAEAQRAQQRGAGMDSLVNQINRVQELYEGGLRGQGLGSVLEYLPDWASDTNAQFNSAAAGLAEQGLSAFRVPGVGAQSDAELRQFVAANRPQASDRDTAIEEKLRQLRARVDATRRAMGLPPAEWRGGQPQPGQRQDRGPGVGGVPWAHNLPDEPVSPFTPAQQRAYDAILAQNPRATVAQISQSFRNQGIPVPNNLTEIVRVMEQGGGFQPGSNAQFGRPDISDARGAGGVGETIDSIMRGAADIPSFGFADEISAMGDTLASGGTYRENLHRQRAIDEYDRDTHTIARLGGQFGGALLLPSRAPGAFAAGGSRAGAAQLGREGAVLGGGYGFGSSNGDLGDRLISAGVNAPVGALAGYGTGRALGPLMTPRAAPTIPPERAEIIRAMNDAQGLGINMMPADVAGPTVRRATGVAYQLPLSTAFVTQAARRTTNQAQAARDNIGAGVGAAQVPEAAGEAARAGGRTFISRTSRRGGDLYKYAEQLAEGVPIQPAGAIAALDRNIAELSQVPGGAEGLAALQQLRQSLVGESDEVAETVSQVLGRPLSQADLRLVRGVSPRPSFTVQGIRGMRTALRDQFAQQGLRGSDIERRTNQVLEAAADDITTSLQAAGRADAAQAFQTADRYWRARLRTIDQVLDPIIGNGRSGEQIVAGLQAAGRGNSSRARQFINSLPEEERATVRASLIDQLGRSAPSQQNPQGTAFSLETFLTHWNQIQPGARAALFGPDASRALQRLANVAGQSRQAGRYQNFSQTGAIIGGVGTVTHLGAEPISAVALMAGQVAFGKLLASPRFARWLASAPRNPRAMPAYVSRLSQVARAEPALAADIIGLQQRLQQAFGSSPSLRAAAEEDRNVR